MGLPSKREASAVPGRSGIGWHFKGGFSRGITNEHDRQTNTTDYTIITIKTPGIDIHQNFLSHLSVIRSTQCSIISRMAVESNFQQQIRRRT